MRVQIDMTNYEAFYLDYLEGNLSGEALAAFEAFLLAHPELEIDDSPMFTLEPAEETFDPVRKLALKKGIDMDDLNTETIEFFLIAREEGLLDAEQKAHLNHWLEANAHYRQDSDLYALVQLEANESEVYAGKESLKKPLGGGRVIPMWWSAGAAVAAGVALIVTIGLNSGNGGENTTGTIANHPVNIHRVDSTDKASPDMTTDSSNKEDRANTSKKQGIFSNPDKQKRANEKPHPVRKQRPGAYQKGNILLHETVIASLEKRKAVIPGNLPAEATPVVIKSHETVAPQERSNEDLAITVDEMKNPIKPVTNIISRTFNTPVDYRTAKASKRKGGGFFAKLGTWELSHTPGSQSASL